MKFYIDWVNQFTYTETELQEMVENELNESLDYGNLDDLEDVYDFNSSEFFCEIMTGKKTVEQAYDEIVQRILDIKICHMDSRELNNLIEKA